MTLSASFHKNVYLLSQMVSPNEAFRRHFREGMFEKPNTAGFICVSHFLLTIYDAERFKKLVEWPIACKKSESKYRTDVKDFIAIVASEHPEAGFPPILGTYLLHAGGTKFTIVMWKLSQVVLYVYIKRQGQSDVLSIPQSGITDEVTKSLLSHAISHSHRNIIELNKKFCETVKKAKETVEEEATEINNLQNETFGKRKAISELAEKVLASQVVKKRVVDVQDVEIIEMWKKNLSEEISLLQERTSILKSIEDLCMEVAELTMSLLNDSRTLDVSKLPSIDVNNDLHSLVSPEIQVLFSHMYKEGELVLQNLLTVVYKILCNLRLQLQAHRMQNLSQYLLQIQASNEDAASMLHLFLLLLDRVKNLATEVHNSLKTKNTKYIAESTEVILQVMDDVLFMPSPTICIDTDPEVEKMNVQNRLALTPVEGAHKALFSRHKRMEETTPQSSKLRTNLLVSRMNFDDTMSSITSERLTPQNRKLKMTCRLSSAMGKKSGKYSRLFSSHPKSIGNRANSSVLSIPSSPKANSTALISTIGETSSIPEMTLDLTAKSLFNLSKEIISVVSGMTHPNNQSPLKQNKPQPNVVVEEEEGANDLKKSIEAHDGSSILLDKVVKPNLHDNKELEVTSECTSATESPKNHKRRSISDLVERYKLILQKSSISSHMETSENSNDST
ncbi:HAUS augmin-like complex subunit 6 [Athalia rosae]|uniref:HAUS augmin-like complex subunit 6 n=1 Tax=Athalia rosae TaxID=37344 RepID=UPI0020347567|nr:HAUS augmin-like complex subunit 6 [Athalia rosae]